MLCVVQNLCQNQFALFSRSCQPISGSGIIGGRRDTMSAHPLQGLSILDVGCGGGLFSEALARLGASVTGIDASEGAIFVAREHARADAVIQGRTAYRNITAEQAVDKGQRHAIKRALHRLYPAAIRQCM